MQIDIPAATARAIGILEQHGYAAYLVGGCVRDACRGAQPYDWDIATSALPAEILKVFADFRTIPTGLRHGTVTVRMDGEPLEITTFRSDGVYTDHRRPDGVTFVDDLQADLVRRDFTVNAMAYNPRVGLVDLFGGCDDLEKGILRAVGDPDRRFDEDALRILRALRFAARFGFAIEARTGAAMRRKAHLLACVSRERVFEELKKLLMGAYAGKVLLDYADIVQASTAVIISMMCGHIRPTPLPLRLSTCRFAWRCCSTIWASPNASPGITGERGIFMVMPRSALPWPMRSCCACGATTIPAPV